MHSAGFPNEIPPIPQARDGMRDAVFLQEGMRSYVTCHGHDLRDPHCEDASTAEKFPIPSPHHAGCLLITQLLAALPEGPDISHR